MSTSSSTIPRALHEAIDRSLSAKSKGFKNAAEKTAIKLLSLQAAFLSTTLAHSRREKEMDKIAARAADSTNAVDLKKGLLAVDIALLLKRAIKEIDDALATVVRYPDAHHQEQAIEAFGKLLGGPATTVVDGIKAIYRILTARRRPHPEGDAALAHEEAFEDTISTAGVFLELLLVADARANSGLNPTPLFDDANLKEAVKNWFDRCEQIRQSVTS